ncbi:hypothetical protein B0H14DRAFT_2565337 [Mycena olivaceomarginata]|nr:hypothetical protein B0H14DRAFT_2565337 [Mycena olivaceomarginata]
MSKESNSSEVLSARDGKTKSRCAARTSEVNNLQSQHLHMQRPKVPQLSPLQTPRSRCEEASREILDRGCAPANFTFVSASSIGASWPGADYMEPADGSITDGDDYAWSANPEILAGGGGWCSLDFSSLSLLGKCTRLDQESDDGSSAADAEEIQQQFFPSFDGHESDDEKQVDAFVTHLQKRADKFEQAAAILRAQVPRRNKLWMSSVVNGDIGRDVSQMVTDIHRFERTSRVRDTTWAKNRDKEGRRQMQNTIGYQIPLEID